MPRNLLLIPFAIVIFALLQALSASRVSADTETSESTDAYQPQQWRLPGSLSEASGLARINETTLLSHNDEKGRVYRIRLPYRGAEKVAQIGKPSLRADFEGIATADGRVFLVTSGGALYRLDTFALDGVSQLVKAQKLDTGLKDTCEIEGLLHLDGSLLMPCKKPINPEYKHHLTVFAHELATAETHVRFSIHRDNIPGLKDTDATAIDHHDGTYYLLSGRNLVLIDETSLATRVYKLRKRFHIRPEGLAVMDDGSIYVVDDANDGDGILSRYASLAELKLKE